MAHSRAKRNWRRYRHKPVRKVRRVGKRFHHYKKRRSHHGKGSSGWGRSSYLSVQAEVSYFTGGRKGSGKGFGKRGNPMGRDGTPLKCHNCGSTEHLIAKCPTRGGKGGGAHMYVSYNSDHYKRTAPPTQRAASPPPPPPPMPYRAPNSAMPSLTTAWQTAHAEQDCADPKCTWPHYRLHLNRRFLRRRRQHRLSSGQ